MVSEPTYNDNCIKLTTEESIVIQKAGLVEVRTDNPTYCGDVNLEGYSCAEYHLHKGAYHIDQGKCHLVLTNLKSEELVLAPNTLLARATPFVEKSIYNVNRIHKDLSAMEPLERLEIKVGKDVSDEDVDKLHTLFSHCDCFAMNLGEIGLTKDVDVTNSLER